MLRSNLLIALFGCALAGCGSASDGAAAVEATGGKADTSADAAQPSCGDPQPLLTPYDNMYEAALPNLADGTDHNDLRSLATLVPPTEASTLVAGLGVREINGRLFPARDVDWYSVRFDNDTADNCDSCFNPSAGLGMRDGKIGPDPGSYEVCVFVSSRDVASRGAMKCDTGSPASYYDLVGCCATNGADKTALYDSEEVQMETPWNVGPGDSVNAFIRVRTLGAACQGYQLNYNHFWG